MRFLRAGPALRICFIPCTQSKSLSCNCQAKYGQRLQCFNVQSTAKENSSGAPLLEATRYMCTVCSL
jgi:hypothetical protein